MAAIFVRYSLRRACSALAFLLASAAGAAACQPTSISAAAEALLRAEAIFVGRATSMAEVGSPDALPLPLRMAEIRPVEVALQVEDVWKGEAPEEAISFNHLICDGPFVVGVPYLFVISKRPDADFEIPLSDEIIDGRPILLVRDWMGPYDQGYLAEMRVYFGRLERGAPYAVATNNLSVVQKRFGVRP